MDKNEALQVALQAMRSMKKDLDDYAAEVGEDYDDLTADMMVGDQLNYIEGKVVSEPFKGALFFSSEHEVMESIINNMWDEGDRLGKKACRFEAMDAPEVVIDRVMERSDLYISAAYMINDEVLPTLSKETVKLPNRKVKTKAYRDWEDGKESCIKCECTLHGKNSAWYMMDDKCDEVCKDCEDWDDD